MGRVVFAAAMSHVLDPDYYGTHCGPAGRRMVEELMARVAEMGARMMAARPDALVVVADDHLNVFSFNAVPALCVRIGTHVERMEQDHAVAFDRLLDLIGPRVGLLERLTVEFFQNHQCPGGSLRTSVRCHFDQRLQRGDSGLLQPARRFHARRGLLVVQRGHPLGDLFCRQRGSFRFQRRSISSSLRCFRGRLRRWRGTG